MALVVALGVVLAGAPAQSADRWGGKLTDQEVADAIEDQLLFDAAVDVNAIDVLVTNGVVTLKGSVDNLLAKERATRIAETVKGVRSVVDRIDVKPYWGRSDTEIEKDARAALLRDPATDSWEIDVQVRYNAATISGEVDSWREKQLAETVVAGVRGVTSVDNEITVRYDTKRPDFEIEKEVEQTLRWDVLVDDALVDVRVKDGEVILDGVVGSAAEKRRARFDAWVAGVRGVDDSALEVKYWARDPKLRQGKYEKRSDEEIAKAIDAALVHDPRVLSANVQVDVTAGIATLRGSVESLSAKRAATEDARHTVGVTQVLNRLRVRPEALSDKEIEANLDAALAWNPFVSPFEIDATVVDGTAYLSGDVDSFFEKGEAEDVAARTYGVEDVRNNLTVEFDEKPIYYDPYVSDVSPFLYVWYDYEPYYTFESDAAIERAIESELWWSPYVDSDDVTVTVEGGHVTLTGTVDTWTARDAAAQNAFEGGAVWVDNDLMVK